MKGIWGKKNSASMLVVDDSRDDKKTGRFHL